MFRVYISLALFLLVIQGDSNRVLLRDVKTLTFIANKFANSRRGYRIPQLQCIGGSARKHHSYHPTSVQCYSRGWDGSNPQWECKAELDNAVKFGSFDINCEGYDHPDDDYILAGSCGLRYELEFRYGEKTYQKSRLRTSIDYGTNHIHLFVLIALVALAFVLWYYCLRDSRELGFEGTSPGISEHDQSGFSYPNDPPPNYEEATRTRHRHMPRFDATDAHPTAPPGDYGWQPFVRPTPESSSWNNRKTETSSNSWFSNTLSAGAGFLGGYMLGSRSTNDCNRTSYCGEGDRDYSHFHASETRTNHRERSTSPSGTRIATGFSSTSRR